MNSTSVGEFFVFVIVGTLAIEGVLMKTRPDLPRGRGKFDWWSM